MRSLIDSVVRRKLTADLKADFEKIKALAEKKPDNEFLDSVLEQLSEGHSLSDKQKKVIKDIEKEVKEMASMKKELKSLKKASAKSYFFDDPEKKEVSQLYYGKTPPTPSEIKKRPGGKEYSTLNRYLISPKPSKVAARFLRSYQVQEIAKKSKAYPFRVHPTNPSRAGEPPQRRDYYVEFSEEPKWKKSDRPYYADIYNKSNRLIKSGPGHRSDKEAEDWALAFIDADIGRRRGIGSVNRISQPPESYWHPKDFRRKAAALVKSIYIFDFDDTLAVTDTLVGVGRADGREAEVGGPYRTFKEFLRANNIEWEGKGRGTPDKPVFFDSYNFGLYEKATVDQYGHEFRKQDLRDYSQAYFILNHTPLKKILGILRSVSTSPENRVAVVTARATISSAFVDEEGKPIKGRNRDQILDILRGAGVNIDGSDIYTTGDDKYTSTGEIIRGGQPSDKLKVMKKLVEKYDPDNLYFYDDQTKNLNKTMELCSKQFPGLSVYTFIVSPSGQGKVTRGPKCSVPEQPFGAS